ncbi:DUF192 domain-containing protein [Patescibacteria group bacterium]|nr:MAG: DUF192 domain-containing protein [Patescibacteria group bacterium]
MLKNKIAFLVVLGAVAITAAVLGFSSVQKYKTIFLNGTAIRTELAVEAAARARGLSGRESLGTEQGMLFVFGVAERYAFWMIDMRFPIDIIWLRLGKVVDIAEAVPAPEPGTDTTDLPRYWPRLPADMVLEVAAGTVRRTKLKIGDEVRGL